MNNTQACFRGMHPIQDNDFNCRLYGSKQHVGRPLFIGDWKDAMFIHFEVDPAHLQTMVPFTLDLTNEGKAIVSLVAFTMRDMRFAAGGKFTRWMTKPIETHQFLNLRTYVRGKNGEPGIFFIREWLNNKTAVAIGPTTFGLPYRFGEIDYHNNVKTGEFSGEVVATSKDKLCYKAKTEPSFGPCKNNTLDHFLLERYTAFTRFAGGIKAKFRVWHDPWPQTRVDNLELQETSLVDNLFPEGANLVSAHFSPGAEGVWMGRPVPLLRETFTTPTP